MRGWVFEQVGPLPVIVVSYEPRNQNYQDVLVCSILPPDSPVIPQETIVELGNAEPVQGFVAADWIFPIAKSTLDRGNNRGPISREGMTRLDRALAAALGLL